LGTAPATASVSRIAWLIALALAAAHVAVKAPHLGASSLWLDEAVAVHISQLDFLGIIRASREDTTPPLFYLLLAGFERVCGISEAAVRWPSILASSATAAVLFLFARRRLGGGAAWLASALFFLSDVNLRYAREARPYALASLLCLLSFALFFRALERPSRRAWAAVAAVNALMLFTHYGTMFAVAAQGLALLWPWRGWVTTRRFALTHAPVVGAFLAWIVPIMVAGQHHKMDWLAAPNSKQLWCLLNWFAGGRPGGPAFAVLIVGAGIAFASARFRGQTGSRNIVAPLVLWAFAPVVLAVATSFLVPSVHARYLLYVTPGLILFWAAATLELPVGLPRILGATLACVMTVIGFGRSARPREAYWRGVAELARARPADRVLLLPSYEAVSFAYYYDPLAFHDATRTSSRLIADGVRAVDEETNIGPLDLATAREVLLVAASGERGGSIERQLTGQGFAAVERHHFDGVTLSRLTRSGGLWHSP
jgi:mannosyltransferase